VCAVVNVAHTAIGFPSGTLADRIEKEKVFVPSFFVLIHSA